MNSLVFLGKQDIVLANGNIKVLIVDGNSDIGAHVRSYLCCMICLKHIIKSKAVTNRGFPRKIVLSFMRAQHVLSTIRYIFQEI